MSNVDVWGIARYDDNFMINEFKTLFGVTHPCAGSDGYGGEAIDVLIDGQIYYGTPTYLVICPDYKMYFSICNPPTMECLDQFIINCNTVLTADFSVESKKVCQGSYIQFEDQSNGNITTWEWVFEGGVPETSNEINPLVYYPDPGLWDVTLTVSNDVFTNNKTEEAFIEVYANPVVTLAPFSLVCEYTPPFLLTGGLPEGGVYSGAGVENGIFDPQAAGLGEHVISYDFVDENGCSGFAEQILMVDACTGLSDRLPLRSSFYPNPTNGEIFIVPQATGILNVVLYDLIGMKVFERNYEVTDLEPVKVVLNAVPPGIYLMQIIKGTEISTSKITILKD